MNVEQIYGLVNTITSEVLGDSVVVAEDLSNVVELGDTIVNVGAMDKYVKSLIDHIGKVVFVDRPYKGSVPNVLMDGWEYGSILEKISIDKYPDATKNDSWDLQDGHSYDPNVFTSPKVSAKFYNNKDTFEIPMSFAEKQVRSAFSSVGQMNAFFSMIENSIENAMTIKIDGMVMATIDSMLAEVISSASTTQVVHLVTEYNTQFSQNITSAQAMTDPDFIRWASLVMSLYVDRLQKLSTLFNGGGKERFTPADKLNVVLLSDFAKAADVYLQSDTYHNEFTKLPNAATVPYWQGSGTSYQVGDTSKIIITRDGVTTTQDYIVGAMFDHDALGVTCLDRRVTSNYNPRGEFYNNWYKFDAGYFNDLNENCVVFIAD